MITRALLMATFACAAAAHAASVSVRDDAGHDVTLAAPATRVISLAPHLTELAFAAGGGAAVKAVIRYSDFPAEAKTLPVVGDAFTLDIEAIARAKPELVLVWGSGLNERHKTRLRSLGLTLYESEIRDAAGIAATLRKVGTLLGSSASAEAAARNFEADWRGLRDRYAGRPPLRVFWQLWSQPLMTVNDTHGIGQAIALCGGVNLFGALPLLTPTVSLEAAVAADPQLIAASGRNVDATHEFERWQRFGQVDAVRRRQFAFIDGDLIGRMGPRFVAGTRALCEAIDRAR